MEALNWKSFSTNYIFNFTSKDLTPAEKMVNFTASALLFAGTAGLAHLVLYLARDKKVSLLDQNDSKNLQQHFVFYKNRADDKNLSESDRKGYQYRVGRMLLEGKGVAADHEEAMRYLHKAAASGSKRAADLLAKEALASGAILELLSQDEENLLRYAPSGQGHPSVTGPNELAQIRAAALAGHPHAAVAYVVNRLNGDYGDYGDYSDHFSDEINDLLATHSQAIKQFVTDHAGEEPYDKVRLKLAQWYSGFFMDAAKSRKALDPDFAIGVMEEIAERGVAVAMCCLLHMLAVAGEPKSQHPLPESIKSRVDSWLEMAEQAAATNPNVAFRLAAIATDDDEQHRWYLTAAENQYQWNQRADSDWRDGYDITMQEPAFDKYMLRIAFNFSNGSYGATQDEAQAFAWWQKAAEQGSNTAQFYLGEALCNGTGVEVDYPKGLLAMNRACTNENDLAKKARWLDRWGSVIDVLAKKIQKGQAPPQLANMDMAVLKDRVDQLKRMVQILQKHQGKLSTDRG